MSFSLNHLIKNNQLFLFDIDNNKLLPANLNLPENVVNIKGIQHLGNRIYLYIDDRIVSYNFIPTLENLK